jgi:hypothetical protein
MEDLLLVRLWVWLFFLSSSIIAFVYSLIGTGLNEIVKNTFQINPKFIPISLAVTLLIVLFKVVLSLRELKQYKS